MGSFQRVQAAAWGLHKEPEEEGGAPWAASLTLGLSLFPYLKNGDMEFVIWFSRGTSDLLSMTSCDCVAPLSNPLEFCGLKWNTGLTAQERGSGPWVYSGLSVACRSPA